MKLETETDLMIAYVQKKANNQLRAGRGETVGGDKDVGGGYTPRLQHVEQHSYAGHALASLAGDLRAGLHLRDAVPAPVAPDAETKILTPDQQASADRMASRMGAVFVPRA